MYLEWNRVRSHTDKIYFDYQGNREVDALAQSRRRANHLTAIFPSIWEKGGSIHVPPEEAPQVVRELHGSLGHVGLVWMRKYCLNNKILIPKL